ncbi:hypothetical protein TanjilG_15778 [Lupinus angustifolius]|uniref:Uncharacterized protein n=1 Tax=Lupinus angustifolius TaxID=3871 RepID=A0A1J7IRL7_LUPAN|nr:hypothetical protein TanjilG_15778 [Lupinus angustifolius]
MITKKISCNWNILETIIPALKFISTKPRWRTKNKTEFSYLIKQKERNENESINLSTN